MRKKFLFGAMAAVLMAATGCQNELDVVKPAGSEATVAISLDIPQKQMGSRAYSDGTTAQRLQYAVYEVTNSGGSKTYQLVDGSDYNKTGENADEISLSKQISFKLLTGKTYGFVFWADNEASPYKVVFDNNDVNMTVETPTKLKANDETLDAFYGYEELQVTGDAKLDAHLYRPFAQVNIGTNDLAQAEELGIKVAKTKVILSGKTTLNLITGETGSTNTSYTFDFNDLPSKEEVFPVEGYEYVAMVYILEPQVKEELYSVSFTYQLEDGTSSGSKSILNVPVQRNYRTNIFGQLFTSNVDMNVVIEPAYMDPDYEADPWRVAMAFGGTVKMQEDKEITSSLIINNSVVLDLNGYDVTTNVPTGGSSIGAIRVNSGASLVIQGQGNLTSSTGTPIVTANDGTVTIKGGTFTNENGHCVYVHTSKSKVVIEGGYFETKAKDNWPLNILDEARANCKPIDLMEVRGGTFVNFDPANNTSEGAGTNYVPEGYVSVPTVLDGSTTLYTVVKAGTTVVGSSEALKSVLSSVEDGSTIALVSGTDLKLDDFASIKGKEGLTIEGNGATITIGEAQTAGFSGTTFKNVHFEGATSNYRGMQHSSNLTFVDCVLDGLYFLYAEGCEFNSCVFNQTGNSYNVWTYSATPVTFNDCVFNSEGRGVNVYADGGFTQEVTFNNCKFYASAPASGKAAIEIGNFGYDSEGSITVNINNCTSEGFDSGNNSNNNLWNHKDADNGKTKVVVKVNGSQVYATK